MTRPRFGTVTPGKADIVRVIGYRHQRTLAAPVSVEGVGFITGTRVSLRFLPAQPDTGLVFRRTDLPDAPTVPARAARVSGTQRRTTLGPQHTSITLVEHVLAALAGLRIDNCVVELDGAEPPGLDGSAAGFVSALSTVATVNQRTRRAIYGVSKPVVVRAPGATLGLHPATGSELRISYRLDYGPGSPIAPQTHTLAITPDTFAHELAPCRTFLTEPEAHGLRAQGVGRHLTGADLLVFGKYGPIENAVRFADEPARHKILDLIGDLALCGFDLAGHLVAYRSGHSLNVELARQLACAAGAGAEAESKSRKSTGRKVVKPASRAA
ncbi:UDP-3-O-acyl-N-acetylglucosamine deacetylase [Gemmata sp. SH-PL17]|uniref:UDP-3-O-acyl-N-acetylglucosamine deacetylase n=1 Tax=Gemmata sp. SH-PL17 TaxID=1630693 RepID=UPI0004BAFE59|nr:UDP-3-O-acyl-N-acetylglucosamine deacetylase [Gemmata sp. SH-PL17]